ncbi:MAG: hypothetical protein ACP5E9_07615 [Candidatus Methanospirareceae archaeon]
MNVLNDPMRTTELTASGLFTALRKGQRTGRWRRLTYREKALVKASLDYLRHGGRILNVSLLEKLKRLVERLTETRGQRIVKRGLAKAAAMLNGIENGISGWVFALKKWLKDPDFIFWLGTVR